MNSQSQHRACLSFPTWRVRKLEYVSTYSSWGLFLEPLMLFAFPACPMYSYSQKKQSLGHVLAVGRVFRVEVKDKGLWRRGRRDLRGSAMVPWLDPDCSMGGAPLSGALCGSSLTPASLACPCTSMATSEVGRGESALSESLCSCCSTYGLPSIVLRP